MENVFAQALKKITNILNTEEIGYMIVGGFAVSYHNRARTTNDIDLILQIYPIHVKLILKYLSELKSDLYYKNEVLFLHVSTFIMCVCIR